MSNGQACFQIEDRAPARDAEASPPTSGVRENFCTIPVQDGRSAAATVPGAGVDRFAETLPFVDEEMLPAPPFEWCVDLGATLITKTTFDLFAAIEQGEIGGNMLVWREGMECWTPVDCVGELSCALELAPPAALLLAEQSPEPAEATTNPEVRRRAIEADSPRISSRRQIPVRAAGAGGGKWIALGSAVAASAIAAAALTTFLAQPPSAASAPREPATAPVTQGAVMSRELPEAASIDTVTVAAPLPPKPRHAESGQRRRR